MGDKFKITPVAESVPFDNSSNDHVSDNVQEAIEEGVRHGSTSSTDNEIVRYDGVTGDLIQDGTKTTLQDDGEIQVRNSANDNGINIKPNGSIQKISNLSLGELNIENIGAFSNSDINIIHNGTQDVRFDNGGGIKVENGITTGINPALIAQFISTTRGVSLPQMTTAQRDAIISPPLRTIIHNTDTSTIDAQHNGSWNQIAWAINRLPNNNTPIVSSDFFGFFDTAAGVHKQVRMDKFGIALSEIGIFSDFNTGKAFRIPSGNLNESIIINGDFSSGTSNWYFSAGTGSASFSVVGGEAKIAVTNQTSVGQLYQYNVALFGSTSYDFEFRGRSDLAHTKGNDVALYLAKHTSPYTNYLSGGTMVFDMSNTMATYTGTRTTTSGNKLDARFSFRVGNYDLNGENYFFDDLTIRRSAVAATDFAVNAAAYLSADTLNEAIYVARFDDTTEEGIFFDVYVPNQTTNIIIDIISRAETAPASSKVAELGIYSRRIYDGLNVQAWQGVVTEDIDISTDTKWHYQTVTKSLSSLGMGTNVLHQIELTRNAGHANDTLVGDWTICGYRIRFS